MRSAPDPSPPGGWSVESDGTPRGGAVSSGCGPLRRRPSGSRRIPCASPFFRWVQRSRPFPRREATSPDRRVFGSRCGSGAVRRGRPGSDGQAMSSLRPAAFEDLLAIGRPHPAPETMRPATSAVVWLVRPLQEAPPDPLVLAVPRLRAQSLNLAPLGIPCQGTAPNRLAHDQFRRPLPRTRPAPRPGRPTLFLASDRNRLLGFALQGKWSGSKLTVAPRAPSGATMPLAFGKKDRCS